MTQRFTIPPTALRYGLCLILTVMFCVTVDSSDNLSSNVVALGAEISFTQSDLDLSELGAETTPDISIADDKNSNVQNDAETQPVETSESISRTERAKFIELVLAGGWIGLILLLGSIVAVSLIIRLCFLLRRSVFISPDIESKLSTELSKGAYSAALEIAESDNSFFTRVVASGIKELDRGWSAAEKALEDAVSEETADLYRKTEPIATIGNVAPMLGLLGTVLGMVSTFGELAISDASGRNLANGIYFALVTTVDGLLVAIPLLLARSLLNARIAVLVSEASKRIDRLFETVKRRQIPTHERASHTVAGLREVSRPQPQPLPDPPNRTIQQPVETPTQEYSQRPSLSLKNRR